MVSLQWTGISNGPFTRLDPNCQLCPAYDDRIAVLSPASVCSTHVYFGLQQESPTGLLYRMCAPFLALSFSGSLLTVWHPCLPSLLQPGWRLFPSEFPLPGTALVTATRPSQLGTAAENETRARHVLLPIQYLPASVHSTEASANSFLGFVRHL